MIGHKEMPPDGDDFVIDFERRVTRRSHARCVADQRQSGVL